MAKVRVEKSDTDRARYRFRVAEFADGTPWIMTDPYDKNLELLVPVKGFLGFDLPAKTTYEKAQEIAKFLNDNIEAISCTSFPGGFEDVEETTEPKRDIN